MFYLVFKHRNVSITEITLYIKDLLSMQVYTSNVIPRKCNSFRCNEKNKNNKQYLLNTERKKHNRYIPIDLVTTRSTNYKYRQLKLK